MGDTEEMQRLHQSRQQLHQNPFSSSLNQIEIPQMRRPQHLLQNYNTATTPTTEPKRLGIPPISPYSHTPSRTFSTTPPTHSRSLSQPSSFFSLDSLPPLTPTSYTSPDNVQADVALSRNSNLPPRKCHRRSNSDVPFGIVKREEDERKNEGDDLFSAYMNLDNIENSLNGGNEGNWCCEERNEHSANGSATRENSSDNEAESSVNESERREGVKRSAAGHYRSVSMDSFMGKLNLGEGNGLELGNGEFSSVELKKIMANDKLSEIAMTDPKRVKRILANRQSAARSKERKMRYISELEHKVQTLQTEATTLSAQLTLLQRDSVGLTNQNNELKFRLQAMEQQAQLRDALNEALTAEVRRLKLATGEINGDSDHAKGMVQQQLSMNPQMFQLQQSQASSQLSMHQMQPSNSPVNNQLQRQQHTQAQSQSQQQNNAANGKTDSTQ